MNDLCTKSFLIEIKAFLVIPSTTCEAFGTLHLLTVHINKCFLNMGALPSQGECALGLEKESVDKMHLFPDSTWSSKACYRANKNKCRIPYSEVIFVTSYHTVTVQCL